MWVDTLICKVSEKNFGTKLKHIFLIKFMQFYYKWSVVVFIYPNTFQGEKFKRTKLNEASKYIF